jgi:hypothetical protein
LVNGEAEFEDIVEARGYAGTGLLVDGGGAAIFGAAAAVSLGADITLGDAGGAGTLMVLTDEFDAGGNVTLAAAVGGAGSEAAVLGAMSIAGTLEIGLAGAAAMQVQGSLTAGSLALGTSGMLQLLGTAQAGFTSISNQGTILIAGSALTSAAYYQGSGALEIGGTATLSVAGLAGISGAGAVSIGSGAELVTGSFEGLGSTVYAAGLITATSGMAIGTSGMAIGTMSLNGGTLEAPLITVESTMIGNGVIAAPSIVNDGLIEAALGRLVLTGKVSNLGLLEIATGGILEVGGTISSAPVSFEGPDAELVLDDSAASDFGVVQMGASDAIDLVGISPSLVSIGGGGVGYILNSQGSVAAQFVIEQAGTGEGVITVLSDGAGGSLLTVNGVLPCFARGTGILSPHGYRPVESLRPNDPVITANGERRPVRWIGWRTLDLGPEAARAARPVLIMPHAFGRGRPHKMLRLSPSHCIHAGGVLIPVTHLVNGATILRDTSAQAATYFHIELDRHDIVLADGLECESYFDDGNRAVMYRELGRRCPARRAYAPVVTSGGRLAKVRRILHEIALEAGFTAQFQPSLRAVAAGQNAIPEILRARSGRVARFAFAQPVKALMLLSATSCPADTDPESEDRRELGICLGEMQGTGLGAGWHTRAPGDIGSWMGARAELGLARGRRVIELPLAAIAQSWGSRPVDARRMGG